jgi:hypothetical protein
MTGAIKNNMMEASILPGRVSLKRPFVLIPILLLILLNACGNGDVPNSATQTAAMWTITPSPTPIYAPNAFAILQVLNTEMERIELMDEISWLEHMIGADYQVSNVLFQYEGSTATVFQVNTQCECKDGDPCCNPEHTFVETMRVMKIQESVIVSQVPGTVTGMEVWCYDQDNKQAVMSAPWNYTKSFLEGQLTGAQFASQVEQQP